ncbi:MAG: hypothetical protein ACRDQA_17090 [Nocardioidaceae bacterium]
MSFTLSRRDLRVHGVALLGNGPTVAVTGPDGRLSVDLVPTDTAGLESVHGDPLDDPHYVVDDRIMRETSELVVPSEPALLVEAEGIGRFVLDLGEVVVG